MRHCLPDCFARRTAGARETVRFLPPLNVSSGEVDEALAIFEAALGDVFGSSQSIAPESQTKGRAGS